MTRAVSRWQTSRIGVNVRAMLIFLSLVVAVLRVHQHMWTNEERNMLVLINPRTPVMMTRAVHSSTHGYSAAQRPLLPSGAFTMCTPQHDA